MVLGQPPGVWREIQFNSVQFIFIYIVPLRMDIVKKAALQSFQIDRSLRAYFLIDY